MPATIRTQQRQVFKRRAALNLGNPYKATLNAANYRAAYLSTTILQKGGIKTLCTT